MKPFTLPPSAVREMELWAARKRERESGRDGLRVFAIRCASGTWVGGLIRRSGVSLTKRASEDSAQRFQTRDQAVAFIARHKANNPNLADAEVRPVVL